MFVWTWMTQTSVSLVVFCRGFCRNMGDCLLVWTVDSNFYESWVHSKLGVRRLPFVNKSVCNFIGLNFCSGSRFCFLRSTWCSPWINHQLITGPTKKTLTPKASLDLTFNLSLNCMCMGCGKGSWCPPRQNTHRKSPGI